MARKYVYGTYPNVVELEDAVSFVIDKGVPRDSITVVGSNAHDYTGIAEFATYGEITDGEHDHRGFFEKLFDFGYDDEDDVNVDLSQYEDSLTRDELLLLVDQEYESQLTGLNFNDNRNVDDIHRASTTAVVTDEALYRDDEYRTDAEILAADSEVDTNLRNDYDDVNVEDNDYEPHYVGEETHIEAEEGTYTDTDFDNRDDVETERIRLHEEEVDAHVRKRDLGDVTISKEVVEETETIEVPVEREEIRIHHNRPTDGSVDSYDDAAFVEEDIVIPVSEEEVVVDKNVVVSDEVEIEKVVHKDTETVTETTRHEELEIDDDTNQVTVDEDLDRDRF